MSETKLLPCPFCGGEADLVKYIGKLDCKKFAVECRNIECPTLPCTEWYLDKEEAIKAWNTRKPMDDIVARLEKESDYWLDKYDEQWKKGFLDVYSDGCVDSFDRTIEIVKEVINK